MTDSRESAIAAHLAAYDAKHKKRRLARESRDRQKKKRGLQAAVELLKRNIGGDSRGHKA